MNKNVQSLAAVAVFHPPALREPDEIARPKLALVGGKDAVQDVDAMSVRMGVPGIGEPGGVAQHDDGETGLRVAEQGLAGNVGTGLLNVEHLPRHTAGVGDGQLDEISRNRHLFAPVRDATEGNRLSPSCTEAAKRAPIIIRAVERVNEHRAAGRAAD